MTLRKRIIVIIAVVLAIVAVIVVVLLFRSKKNTPATNTPERVIIDSSNVETAVTPGIEPTQVPKEATVKPPSASQKEEITVRNLAKVFVERYHTYSSENNYQNIRDVEEIVTATYWKKISAPLNQNQTPPASFVAMTVEVVSVVSVDISRDIGKVVIRARKTATSNSQTTTSFADYEVALLKTPSGWLVSGETVK